MKRYLSVILSLVLIIGMLTANVQAECNIQAGNSLWSISNDPIRTEERTFPERPYDPPTTVYVFPVGTTFTILEGGYVLGGNTPNDTFFVNAYNLNGKYIKGFGENLAYTFTLSDTDTIYNIYSGYTGTAGWNGIDAIPTTRIEDIPFNVMGEDSGESKPASVAGFVDVAPGAFYADAVKWALDKKITSGIDETHFAPDADCSVAQILSFLHRGNGSPKPTGQNPFSDVSAGDYYYDAALWAYENGLVSGGKFNPDAPCTRVMTVEYLWKLAGSPVVFAFAPALNNYGYVSEKGHILIKPLEQFDDVPLTSDYAQAVMWAVKESITSGVSETQFAPDTVCSRGQIVTFLYRAYGL